VARAFQVTISTREAGVCFADLLHGMKTGAWACDWEELLGRRVQQRQSTTIRTFETLVASCRLRSAGARSQDGRS